MNKRDYYVYAHVRLDSNKIFYVGKGRKNRCYRKERNKHWKHIVDKAGYKVLFLEEQLSEGSAFKMEAFWISRLKKDGQCIANYSLGGEGCSGYRWTKAQRQRHSQRLKKRTPAMTKGQARRIKKIKGRKKETHKGLMEISKKNSGEGNGRAIWSVLTPDGVFSTIKETAKAYAISTAGVHRRIKSNSVRFSSWKKVLKESK